jgi:hypothetical protein
MSESRLKQTLRRLGDDDRAVSPVVGFVLMFALVMLVFTLYQSSVVPAQNAEVEFEHSQVVEGEISQLNDALADVAAGGAPKSVTVSTGLQYPDRVLAINPGNPSGAIATSDPGEVELSGLSGDSGYWSDAEPLDTRLLSYTLNYNQLQQEPTHRLEHGVHAEVYDNGNTLINSNGSLITNNGNQINLLLVGGDYDKGSISTSVTAQPVSTSTEYHQLETDSSGGSIRLPTELSADAWKQILSEKEYADFAGVSGGEVTINLDGDHTYSIRVTKVSLDGSGSPDLAYLEREDGRPNRTAAIGTSETFTVSARDEFGNPLAGALVDASTTGAGNFTRTDPTGVAADDNGRVSLSYTPNGTDAGNTTQVTLSLANGSISADRRNVTYNVTVPAQEDEDDGSNGSSFGAGDLTNGYNFGVVIDSATVGGDIVFNNTGTKDVDATAVRISGNFQSPGGGAAGSPDTVQFDGQEISLNGDLEPLDTNVSIGSGETEDVPFGIGSSDNSTKDGFLIMTVKYSYTVDGEPETAFVTYATYVESGTGNGGPGDSPPGQ